MLIEWVNNASFILESGAVRLICDPWLEGTIFNRGWKLLSVTKLRYEEFAGITHIWLSHEHPDHFSPPTLKAIPEEHRKNITVLFHHTKDKRVLHVCKAFGFKTQELVEWEPVELAPDFTLLCGRQGLIDSWMAVFAEGKTLLNMNDCVFDYPKELAAIQDKVGKVDVLLSQFSYANWVGNPDDHACHREHAEKKRREIREHIERFQPATFVPFASFIYFSHAENFFMNSAVNRIRDVYEFVTRELKVPAVVLYPGDVWPVGAARDSREAILQYELDLDRIKRAPRETTPSVPLAKLQQAAHAFILKSSHRNTRFLLKALSPSVVRLRDLGVDVELSYRHGIVEVQGKQPDIILSSDSLLYCLRYDWGGECLAINGRYEIPSRANPQWFFWTFRVPAHNRAGNTLNFRFLADQLVKRTRRAMTSRDGG
jgi:hypothetical protein